MGEGRGRLCSDCLGVEAGPGAAAGGDAGGGTGGADAYSRTTKKEWRILIAS